MSGFIKGMHVVRVYDPTLKKHRMIQVELSINIHEYARLLARSALQSKHQRATRSGGNVVCRIIQDEQNVETVEAKARLT